jgi:hypothetical protein
VAVAIRRPPWVRQPPRDATAINWNNPITRGLVAASIAGGAPSDLTPYTANNGPGVGVGANGREGLLTSTNPGMYWSSAASNIVTGFPFTIVAAIRPTATTTQAVFSANATGDTQYHELYLTVGTGAILRSQAASGASAAVSSGFYTTNESFVLGGRVSSAAERSLWKNGRSLASNTTSVSPNAAVVNRWGLFNTPNIERFSGGYAVRLLWNRGLSDEEMFSATVNPWQVFAPPTPSIWVPGPGGFVSNPPFILVR